VLISIISAVTNNNVIGKSNAMPWYIPEELNYFKKMTVGKPMIMGSVTFVSMGCKSLLNRISIVLTNNKEFESIDDNVIFVHSINHALNIVKSFNAIEVMVVGGATVYKKFLPISDRIYLSVIKNNYEGNVLFPRYDVNDWSILKKEFYDEFIAYTLNRKEPYCSVR